MQNNKHFSPHLRGLPHQQAKKEAAKGPGQAQKVEGTIEHAETPIHASGHGVGGDHSKMHGTQPHPKTGVHSVHIHHMGGGKVMSHTHHDDESKGDKGIETQEHGSVDEAKAHVDSMLPSEEADMHQEPDGDENYASSGDDDSAVGSLGQMV